MDPVQFAADQQPLLDKTQQTAADAAVPPLAREGSLSDQQRLASLELLREQLQLAKIPVTKRASISELPQPAADCQLVAGTTRCALTLCEDACTLKHQHHHTHAARTAHPETLVYQRPSVSVLSSTTASPYESPAVSVPQSTTNSPQQQYRRASSFGFNFGARGSVTSCTLQGSGGVTPADVALSAPPSPISDGGNESNPPSQPGSPREQQRRTLVHTVQASEGSGAAHAAAAQQAAPFVPVLPSLDEREEIQPSLESTLLLPAPSSQAHAAASAAMSSGGVPSAGTLPTGEYWKFRSHMVNLNDYRPAVGPSGQLLYDPVEARMRTDLAADAREDFEDQVDPSWDPRSPQPPSPVDIEFAMAQIRRVNVNDSDRTKPQIEYELEFARKQ